MDIYNIMAGGRYFYATQKKAPKRKEADKKIARIAQRVVSRNIEHKIHDYDLTPTAISYNGIMTNITSIFQGDTANTRNGRFITPTKLKFRWLVSASATDAYNSMRILIVKWKEDDLVAPVPGNVLQHIDSVDAPQSQVPFENNAKKFSVIYDNYVSVTSNTGSGGSSVRSGTVTLSRKKLSKIMYDLGNVDTGYGNYYLVAASDSAAVSHPRLQLHTRMHYEDA